MGGHTHKAAQHDTVRAYLIQPYNVGVIQLLHDCNLLHDISCAGSGSDAGTA